MGFVEVKYKEEKYIYDLWNSSNICQTSPEDYIQEIKFILEKIKNNTKKEKDSKNLADALMEQVVEKYIVNTAEFQLFESVRTHIYKDNLKHKLGYHIFFSMVFLIDTNIRKRVWMFTELFALLKDIYNLKGNIKTNPILFTNIVTMYIDLVSFCIMGYYLKINLDSIAEEDFIIMNKIFKSFNFDNRGLLIKELFSAPIFSLYQFLEVNEDNLDHNQIRKKMIEYDYGKDGFLKISADVENENDKKDEKNEKLY